jgi:hypothetical protein
MLRFMKVLMIFVLSLITLECHAQFFHENPVDSGTFYLQITRSFQGKEQLVKCSRAKLMYFYQRHRAGLSCRDLAVIAKPVDSLEFVSIDGKGSKWEITGLQSNDGTPDILELRNASGMIYRVSNEDICQ